jgi:hypothetical protein
MVSGAFIGTDMQSVSERQFLARTLRVQCDSTNTLAEWENVTGMGKVFPVYRMLNEQHYAATHADILEPVGNAFGVMTYADGTSACIASEEKGARVFIMGFPFECIKDVQTQGIIMRGIMSFLTK